MIKQLNRNNLFCHFREYVLFYAHILFKHSCIKHLALNIRENSDLTPKATADLDDNFLILPISFQLKFHQNMLGQEKKNIIE